MQLYSFESFPFPFGSSFWITGDCFIIVILEQFLGDLIRNGINQTVERRKQRHSLQLRSQARRLSMLVMLNWLQQ